MYVNSFSLLSYIIGVNNEQMLHVTDRRSYRWHVISTLTQCFVSVTCCINFVDDLFIKVRLRYLTAVGENSATQGTLIVLHVLVIFLWLKHISISHTTETVVIRRVKKIS